MSAAVETRAKINEQAAIVLQHEIEIAASPSVVWDVLTAIDAWPTWNPAVSSATLEGDLAPGSTFRWKSGGSSIRSQLTHVDPSREIAWTGKAMGLRVVHLYRLEARNGATLVSTEESVEGFVAALARGPIRSKMSKVLVEGLSSLRTAVEQRAGA